MAYTTRNTVNTVNKLARKELNSNPVHVVLELSKEKETYTSSSRNINGHKLGQIAARNKRISLDKRNIFLEVKLAVSEEKRGRANVIPVKRIYLLYLQTVLIIAGPASRYRMKVSNTFTVNVIFCPSKANSWRS